ncbi:proline-rich protein 2-like [Harpia harpyja]|uniref:proline-rich protein 2-like n=1 Tax=Harpia harpyja TaxID=202280 RepID=UPI0022B1F78D|nr:proline-rich protein 2-like [Harpia harpyja]
MAAPGPLSRQPRPAALPVRPAPSPALPVSAAPRLGPPGTRPAPPRSGRPDAHPPEAPLWFPGDPQPPRKCQWDPQPLGGTSGPPTSLQYPGDPQTPGVPKSDSGTPCPPVVPTGRHPAPLWFPGDPQPPQERQWDPQSPSSANWTPPTPLWFLGDPQPPQEKQWDPQSPDRTSAPPHFNTQGIPRTQWHPWTPLLCCSTLGTPNPPRMAAGPLPHCGTHRPPQPHCSQPGGGPRGHFLASPRVVPAQGPPWGTAPHLPVRRGGPRQQLLLLGVGEGESARPSSSVLARASPASHREAEESSALRLLLDPLPTLFGVHTFRRGRLVHAASRR